jgi:peroxiredoxin
VQRPRIFAIALLAAVVVGTAGGWWWSTRSDSTAHLGAAGADTLPTDGIPVATDVTGKPLPAVEAEDLQGQAVALRSLDGEPLILNFWYSTCLPCRKEMPDFEQVHQAMGDRVRIIGVNPLDGAGRAKDFATQVGATYELLRDPDGRVTSALGIARFPTTVFVGADGTVLATKAGALSADTLRKEIQELYPS